MEFERFYVIVKDVLIFVPHRSRGDDWNCCLPHQAMAGILMQVLSDMHFTVGLRLLRGVLI